MKNLNLPCGVDDTIYLVKGYGQSKGITEWRVARIVITINNIWFHIFGGGIAHAIPLEWFGRCAFTEEEVAKEKLKNL